MDIETLRPVLEAMSDLGLVLCVHGETNGFVMDREKEFGSIYESLAQAFPKLKIVMEHITTKRERCSFRKVRKFIRNNNLAPSFDNA